MIKVELNPKEEHLSQIEEWLKEEWTKSKSGFITDWEMIPKAFNEKRLSVLIEKEKAIGFVVFQIHNELAVIDIAEVKPENRKKGVGQKFILETLESFKLNNILVVKLFCSPETSQGFWSKCGFQKFDIPKNNRINMYKVLVPHLKTSNKKQTKDTLKLWDCEPHQSNRKEPKWMWNLNYLDDNKTLINPIIFPAYYDWQLELERNGIKTTNKVKYFPLDLSDNGTFIIIHEIKK